MTEFYKPVTEGQVFRVSKKKRVEELYLFQKYNWQSGHYSSYRSSDSSKDCVITLSGAPTLTPDDVDDRQFIRNPANYLRLGTTKSWKLTSKIEKDENGFARPITLIDQETKKMTLTIFRTSKSAWECLEEAGFDVPTRIEKGVETWKEVKDTSSAAT